MISWLLFYRSASIITEDSKLGTEVRADLILRVGEYAKGFIDFDADVPEGCAVEIRT